VYDAALMDEARTVSLLGFAARVEREESDGVAYLRVDEGTAPGAARRAHAAFEERLATQEPFAADWAPGRRLRVAGLMHDTSEHVVRIKVVLE
jgi:hypothetical protein